MVAAGYYRAFYSLVLASTCLILLQRASAQTNKGRDSVLEHDSVYFSYHQSDWPRDCKEISERCSSRNTSGVHYIKPVGYPDPFEVYCDISDTVAGMTVISRRTNDGLVSFNRNWDSYKKGFGFLSHEFWIGNERLSHLTNQKDYELLIEMTLSDGSTVTVSYHNFRISDESSHYKLLSVTEYSSAADNSSWCSFGRIQEGMCAAPTDCMEVYESGLTNSGVYSIKPTTWPGSPFRVYCNMAYDGGWTVFQRRLDGSVDFDLDWEQYKNGFGNVSHEHWLGNEKLHHLSNQKEYQIRIDVVNTDRDQYYATFDFFRIDNEEDGYRLSEVGNYSGNADECGGDGSNNPMYHRGATFSTKDRNNDDYDSYSYFDDGGSGDANDPCTQSFHGAWWYSDCFDQSYTTLNGRYSSHFRMQCLPGSDNLTSSEMELRPI